jgi:outer membrane protein TolC
MRSAEADLERAEAIRDAGMSTNVDVVSIRVHLAGVRGQQIRREADVEVAQAALNEALGLPLDTPHELTTALTALRSGDVAVGDAEKTAIERRPEARAAKLSVSAAETEAALARSQLRPEVALHGTFEADRQRFVTRAGDNWWIGAELRWNLFNGFADKARIDESKYAVEKRTAEHQQAASGIRLEVRRAAADLRAASQQIQVAEASVAEAEESVRITRNRYEAGMSRVTDLLQVETALLDARTRRLAAIRDQRMAAAMVEFVSGTLGPDSPAINEGAGK